MPSWMIISTVLCLLFLAVIVTLRGNPMDSNHRPPAADDDATWHVKPAPPKPASIFTDERNQSLRGQKTMQPGWTDSEDQRGQRWSKKGLWYETEIVGESHYQQNIESFCAGGNNVELSADLILENDNPHDPKAVRVVIGGKTVGYLSRQDARTYRKMLAAGSAATSYAALVRGNLGQRGVHLSLDMRKAEGV